MLVEFASCCLNIPWLLRNKVTIKEYQLSATRSVDIILVRWDSRFTHENSNVPHNYKACTAPCWLAGRSLLHTKTWVSAKRYLKYDLLISLHGKGFRGFNGNVLWSRITIVTDVVLLMMVPLFVETTLECNICWTLNWLSGNSVELGCCLMKFSPLLCVLYFLSDTGILFVVFMCCWCLSKINTFLVFHATYAKEKPETVPTS